MSSSSRSTRTFYIEWLLRHHEPRVVVIQRNPRNRISSWIELGVRGFDLFDRPAIRDRCLEPLGSSVPARCERQRDPAKPPSGLVC